MIRFFSRLVAFIWGRRPPRPRRVYGFTGELILAVHKIDEERRLRQMG